MLLPTRTFRSARRVVLVGIAMLSLVGPQLFAQTPSDSRRDTSPTAQTTTSQAQRNTKTKRHTPTQRSPKTPAKLVSGRSPSKRSYIPAHERSTEASIRVLDEGSTPAPEADIIAEEVIGQPDVIFEDSFHGPADAMHGSIDDCGCEGPCQHQGCLIPCPGAWWDQLELFGGAHGFTGPLNRGETGSFGFHEGVNWGAPVPCFCTGELAMQAGARFAHSHFNGAEFSDEDRTQTFVTAGVFRRVDWGFQGGVVMDYLSDDWYFESDLAQVRGELSWVYPCNHEIGFWFTANTQEDTVTARTISGTTTTTTTETLRATDLYAFFYRYRMNESSAGNGRLFAGFTGEGDGYLGADLRVPINDCWAVQSGFAYLVPEENDHVEESWNFGIGLTWRPGGGLMCGNNYYRPLFDVADNGTFMVDRD